MLEFTCSTCGKLVQGDDSFAGKHVLCPGCSTPLTAPAKPADSPANAIATPEDAALAKLATQSRDGTFREGLPTQPQPLPPIRKEVPGIFMGWLPWLGVLCIVLLLAALFVPSVERVREASARTQSTNNLKNIGLAIHGFHDANKRLPFNGSNEAVNGMVYTTQARAATYTSGSWAFQILPFIDHAPIFNGPIGTPVGANITTSPGGVMAYTCPGRGRPPMAGGTAPWSDYFINPFVNDPAGVPDAADKKWTLIDITDGTSNTIFVGHGTIKPSQYPAQVATGSGTIFVGGTLNTARQSFVHQPDSEAGGSQWGSPFPQGSLMAMGDATVRMFPFTVTGGNIGNAVPNTLAPFLSPRGGELVTLPDF